MRNEVKSEFTDLVGRALCSLESHSDIGTAVNNNYSKHGLPDISNSNRYVSECELFGMKRIIGPTERVDQLRKKAAQHRLLQLRALRESYFFSDEWQPPLAPFSSGIVSCGHTSYELPVKQKVKISTRPASLKAGWRPNWSSSKAKSWMRKHREL